MLNDYLIKLLKSPAEASAAHWNAVSEFAEQYPYAALAQLFKAKIAKDFNYLQPQDTIRHAAVYSADRMVLKKYLDSSAIELQEPVLLAALLQRNEVYAEPEMEAVFVEEQETAQEAREEVVLSDAKEMDSSPTLDAPLTASLEISEPQTMEEEEVEISVKTEVPAAHHPIENKEEPTLIIAESNNELDDLLASLSALRNNRLHFQEEISAHTAADGSIHFEPDWKPNNEATKQPVQEESKEESFNSVVENAQFQESKVDALFTGNDNIPEESKEAYNDFDSFHSYSPSKSNTNLRVEDTFEGVSNDEKTYLDGASSQDDAVNNPMFDTPFNTEQIGKSNRNAEDIFQALMDESLRGYSGEHHLPQDFISESNSTLEDQKAIIDSFIANSPSIPKLEPYSNEFFPDVDITEKLEEEVDEMELATETLAKLYMRQGRKDKAIETYLKLILKNPEKTAYFTAQIQAAAGSNI